MLRLEAAVVAIAVASGGHYLADVAAGLLLACLSIRLALWCERRLDRMGSAGPV